MIGGHVVGSQTKSVKSTKDTPAGTPATVVHGGVGAYSSALGVEHCGAAGPCTWTHCDGSIGWRGVSRIATTGMPAEDSCCHSLTNPVGVCSVSPTRTSL